MILLTCLALAGAPDPLAVSARVQTLPNGLRVVVERQDRTDEVAVHLHLGVGGRDEGEGERGMAHLFEHLMFEGSAHVPGNQYDALLTAAGGENNAFTSEDETAYHATFPSGALDLVLFLESDRIGFLDDALTVEALQNQIDVVLQERDQGYSAPHGRDFDTLSRLVYPKDHPYHVPVIGTVDDLERASLERVRHFDARWVQPAGAVLGIVGHVDPDHAISRVQHWFSDVPGTPPPERVALPDPPRLSASRRAMIEDEVNDFTLHLAWPGAAIGDEDELPLRLAALILADGRGTRLDELYYRKGWIRGARAQAWTGELDGMFVVSMTTDRDGRLAGLRRVLTREIERLARRPPSAEELEQAKQRARRHLLDALEDPADRAEVLVDCVRLFDDPDCSRTRWAQIQAITPAQISQAIAARLENARVELWNVPRGRADALPEPADAVDLP